MRTITLALLTLLVSTASYPPGAVGAGHPPPPQDVTDIAGVLLTWKPPADTDSQEVRYRVYGLIQGREEMLGEVATLSFVLPSGYDLYGVKTVLGRHESKLATPCTRVDPHENPPNVMIGCVGLRLP